MDSQADDRYFLQNRLTQEQIMAERTFTAPDTLEVTRKTIEGQLYSICIKVMVGLSIGS